MVDKCWHSKPVLDNAGREKVKFKKLPNDRWRLAIRALPNYFLSESLISYSFLSWGRQNGKISSAEDVKTVFGSLQHLKQATIRHHCGSIIFHKLISPKALLFLTSISLYFSLIWHFYKWTLQEKIISNGAIAGCSWTKPLLPKPQPKAESGKVGLLAIFWVMGRGWETITFRGMKFFSSTTISLEWVPQERKGIPLEKSAPVAYPRALRRRGLST